MDNFAALSPAQQQAILHGPAMRPPPGIEPNFTDPPNRNGVVRAYSKLICLKRITTEDVLGLAGIAGHAAYIWAGFAFMQAAGFFVHQWNIQLIQMSNVSFV
ncbi:hypothetical protein DL766_002688 [Monosporascus sp. MC13-8B]|uniref:Uncharacterized protein n=1 Tax=Monosporascus cannonballus TaxID=155416 RepID=A0ABY0H2S5_9PEZI|nr:hypothetical protein DL762_006184 [Monosporascus cannonballus]RYO87804.1 hypothetical protein DL763_006222 [Monosporascus cannonballus]RYP35124.1 hypothetical protein DL766_002688 [Monosporascus sp. MC13-8B]